MSTALTVSGLSSVPSLPAADIEKAADFARQEKAKATQRAYGIDFEIFRTWVRRSWRQRTTGHP